MNRYHMTDWIGAILVVAITVAAFGGFGLRILYDLCVLLVIAATAFICFRAVRSLTRKA